MVAQQAIQSVGKLRKRRLVPELLDRLANHNLRAECAKALGEFGDTIVGALRDHLGDLVGRDRGAPGNPSILVKIGTPTAAEVLMANLLESDTALRFRIISSLNKLRRLHPEIEMDSQTLETVLAAEILGHYRSYQILDKLGTPEGSQDPVARALTESMQQELERIFRSVGLLYPHLDVHSAYLGLQSKNVSVHDNALEFLDNVLKSQLREMLVPLLDGKITVRRARARGGKTHPRQDREPGTGGFGSGQQRRSLAEILWRLRGWGLWAEIFGRRIESLPQRFGPAAARDRAGRQAASGRAYREDLTNLQKQITAGTPRAATHCIGNESGPGPRCYLGSRRSMRVACRTPLSSA